MEYCLCHTTKYKFNYNTASFFFRSTKFLAGGLVVGIRPNNSGLGLFYQFSNNSLITGYAYVTT